MGKLIHQCGQAAVSGIENLERSKGKVTATTFKQCGGLMTPAGMEAAVAYMNQSGATVPGFKAEVQKILKEQWVHWHWNHPENEYIHKTKRMIYLQTTYHLFQFILQARIWQSGRGSVTLWG